MMDIQNRQRIGGVFLLLLVFFIYLRTICPDIYWADSGELVAASFTLGLPHAPSFPLYNILAKIFTLIPLGNIAFKVNLFSALAGAFAVFLLYHFCLSIGRYSEKTTLAFISLLSFAFIPAFWLQSIRAEVYTLNAAIMCLLFISLRKISKKDQKGGNNYLYLFSFLYGLGLSNHSLIMLWFIPGFLYAFFIYRQNISLEFKNMSISFTLLLLGLTLYLYLPLRASQNPVIEMTAADNLTSFMDSFTRRESWGKFFSLSAGFLPHTKTFVWMLIRQYTFFFYGIGIIGIWQLFRRESGLCVSLILVFLTSALASAVNSNFYETNPDIAGYLLPSFIVYSIWFFYGLEGIYLFLVSNRRVKRVFFYPFLLLIPAVIFFTHFHENSKGSHTFPYEYGRRLLGSLEQNAIIFVTKDSTDFITNYLNFVEGRRLDVRAIFPFDLSKNHRIKKIERTYPELKAEIRQIQGKEINSLESPEEHAKDIVRRITPLLLKRRPVYLEAGDFYKEEFLTPHGSLFKANRHEVNEFKKEVVLHHLRLMDALERDSREKSFYLDGKAVEMYASIHNNLGAFFSSRGMMELALEETKKALSMDPSHLTSLINLGVYYKGLGERDKAKDIFKRIIDFHPHSPDGYYNFGNLSYEGGDLNTAIDMYNRVIGIVPYYSSAYNNLALCYLKKNMYRKAKDILEEALERDPKNPSLKNNLEKAKEHIHTLYPLNTHKKP